MKILSTLIVLIFLKFSCANNNTSSENTNLNKPTENEVLFKRWLKDTLEVIHSHPIIDNNIIGLKDVVINVGKDSLSLSITNSYSLIISSRSQSKIKTMVGSSLSLLKEYNEFPPINSILKFKTLDVYFPSGRQDYNYDFTFEIKDLMYEYNNIISKYDYIRGSLNGKHVIKNNTSKMITEDYDFIWPKNKLIKKKVNYKEQPKSN